LNDLLFFILSQRMLQPIAVLIPVFLMYRALGLVDTYAGMIVLYTTFNLPFAVWMMKGFIDEIPREHEDAAMVDGYTRFQAFYKVIVERQRRTSRPRISYVCSPIHACGPGIMGRGHDPLPRGG
jgi:ABC-type maltose transport system permease subunit